MLRVIAINLAILAVLLVGVELIFGTWFSQTHALLQFTKPRNVSLVRANPLPDGPETIRYTRDGNGFRGLTGALDAIDILTVGGSTTDQRYLDDADTFQAQLRALFAAEGREVIIANAGIDGQSSFGHISNFKDWFSRIDGLKPRYVLFYVGINDALIVADKPEYDTVAAQGRLLRAQLFIREKSALYQLYLIAKQVYLSPELTHYVNPANFAGGAGMVNTGTLGDADLDNADTRRALDVLGGNIEELARLTRNMGATPIFVTQRSTAWVMRDGEPWGIREIAPGFLNRYVERFGPINGVDVYRIETRIAGTILARCRAVDAICLDLKSEVPFDPARHFYDEVHTNAEGAGLIARYLYERLGALEGF